VLFRSRTKDCFCSSSRTEKLLSIVLFCSHLYSRLAEPAQIAVADPFVFKMAEVKESKLADKPKPSNLMLNPMKGFADGMKKVTDSVAATMKVPMSSKPKHDVDFIPKSIPSPQVTDRAAQLNEGASGLSEDEQSNQMTAFTAAMKEAFLCVPRETKRVFNGIGIGEGKVYRKVQGRFIASNDTELPVDNDADEACHLPVVAPDAKLQEMNVIIKKKIKGVAIPEFYDMTWAEKTPFYANWLEASGKMDIKVGAWQEGEVKGTWCGETYQRQRITTFQFQRTTHLYTGPPIANVTHTQYCRVEASDKCVLSMTMEMEGIPFADCFKVEVRWVATRVGSKDINIQVGLFVNFVTSTLLANQIRAGTTEETTKSQLSLFNAVLHACCDVVDSVAVIENEETKEKEIEKESDKCFPFPKFLMSLVGASRKDDIALSVKSAMSKLKEIQTKLETSKETLDERDVMRSELAQAHSAIDKLLHQVTEGKANSNMTFYISPWIFFFAAMLTFLIGQWTGSQGTVHTCCAVMAEIVPSITFQG